MTGSARARRLRSHAYVSQFLFVLFFPLSRVFLSLFCCLTCFISPPFLPLPSHSSPSHPAPPPPPSFSRAPSPQSRFASYFQNPLKASHFGIFHSGAAHRLCRCPGLSWIHTCALNLPRLMVIQHRSQISRAQMGFAESNKQCDS